jgi:glycosyltransferase involved in cell wall biosynthesis
MILCVGRLYETKNQVALVKALEELPDDPSLVLIGFPTDADYVSELEEVVGSSRVSDRVHILKTVGPDHPALYNAYAAADVVALPSLFEAFPLVALEAWAAGVPLVASAVGGLNDLVTNGANGLLIERPDEPTTIAEAISKVLTDPSLAAALRAGGTDSVQHYRWDEIAKTLGSVYGRELGKRDRSESLRSSV